MTAKSGKKLPRCPNCGHTPLRDATITDRFPYETGEEEPVWVEVPDVPVQVCDQCGEQYLGPGAARAQHLAVCRALGLLTPDQIKAIRERLGPTQAEFARLTGIGEATISRWERGRMLPNRAMDRYLRLLNARPEEARTLLRELSATAPSPPINRLVWHIKARHIQLEHYADAEFSLRN
jgi:putative zinc finger/helix-turn-helix YgiT family protein